MSLSPGRHRGKRGNSPGALTSSERGPRSTESTSPKRDRLAVMPQGQLSVMVYDPPSSTSAGSGSSGGGGKIKKVATHYQGIWQGDHTQQSSPSPTEIWVFPSDIDPLEKLNVKGHIHGSWGYKPGVVLRENNKDDNNNTSSKSSFLKSNLKPDELWFFPPNTTEYPKYFTKQGMWTFPLVKTNVGQIPHEASGFLKVGESVKTSKLDVGGSWKMLYKRPGLPGDNDDEVKGPGMKPRGTTTTKIIQINVEGPDGTVYKIPGLKPDIDIIDKIQTELEPKSKVPKANQTLVHPNGTILEDPNATLKDSGITKNGMTLQLQAPMTVSVHYKDPYDGKKLYKIPVSVTPTTTIEELQTKLTQDNDVYHNGLCCPDDYEDLEYQGQILENDGPKTLQDYNIPDQAVITAIPSNPWQIFVETTSGKQFTITKLKPTDKLLTIKDRIQKEVGTKVDHQRLLFEDDLLGKNKHTLSLQQLNIPNGATLFLEGMIIYIQDSDDNIFELDVEHSTTIKEVKQKLYQQEGLLPSQQRLSYNDAMLDEEDDDDDEEGYDQDLDPPTLYDYDIPHKATLFLEPMQISVLNVRDQTTIALAADPMDTIGDIKDMVYVAEGIPNNEQNLTFKDTLLYDDTTLKENRIGHGSVIHLEGLQIYIQDDRKPSAANNNEPIKYLLGVDYSDTIDVVKSKLEAQEKIPKAKQHLIFDDNVELEDKATLRELEIQHRETLIMIPMQINVRTPQHNIIQLIVQPDDKIRQVVKMITDATGIPKTEQRLYFGKRKLDDAYKLSSYGIVHGSTIDMVGMQISVQDLDGETFSMSIVDGPTTPIETIKAIIEETTGIAPDDQRLFFRDVKLEDDAGQTLRDYKVKHKSTLELKPMELHVKIPSSDDDGGCKILTLHVDPYDTVASVKERIQEEEDIPVDDQQLLYDGNELEDEPTLSAYGITHGSILDLEGLPSEMMEINIKDWSGKIFTLDVEPNETLESVKNKIEEQEGVPVADQYLLFKKNLLDDDSKTLDEYNIHDKTTLHLDQMKIVVETPRGKFLMDAEPTTTIDDIKNRVMGKVGLPQDRQAVTFDDNELDGPTTISEAGIEYRDSVIINEKAPAAATETPPDSPTNRPTYTVKVGPWQSPFDYKPKPKVKRPKGGVRARKHYNQLSDFYATAVNTDTELNKQSDEKD